MRKTNIIVTLAIVLTTFFSCHDKRDGRPRDLISEKQMVNILYDLHVSEAVSNRLRNHNPDSVVADSKDFYQSVLNKYAVSDSVLARSVLYYSSFPKVYESIYAKVVERINMRLEEMKKEEEKTKQKEIQVIEK